MKNRVSCLALTIGWTMALGLGLSRAELVLEFDFGNLSGTSVTATTHVAGSSGTGTVAGGTVGTNTNAGVPATAIERIRCGSLTTGAGWGEYLVTSGANNLWSHYTGVANFGTITAVIVFKPKDNGTETTIGENLWMTRNSSKNTNPRAAAIRGSNIPFKSLTTSYYSSAWHETSSTNISYAWVNDTWYMIASSWTPDQPHTCYIRPLGSSIYSFQSGTTMTAAPSWADGAITVGGYEGAATGTGTRGADGCTALFQLYSGDYMADADDYETLYQSLFASPPAIYLNVFNLNDTTSPSGVFSGFPNTSDSNVNPADYLVVDSFQYTSVRSTGQWTLGANPPGLFVADGRYTVEVSWFASTSHDNVTYTLDPDGDAGPCEPVVVASGVAQSQDALGGTVANGTWSGFLDLGTRRLTTGAVLRVVGSTEADLTYVSGCVRLTPQPAGRGTAILIR